MPPLLMPLNIVWFSNTERLTFASMHNAPLWWTYGTKEEGKEERTKKRSLSFLELTAYTQLDYWRREGKIYVAYTTWALQCAPLNGEGKTWADYRHINIKYMDEQQGKLRHNNMANGGIQRRPCSAAIKGYCSHFFSILFLQLLSLLTSFLKMVSRSKVNNLSWQKVPK
jgi:hypothetical protein